MSGGLLNTDASVRMALELIDCTIGVSFQQQVMGYVRLTLNLPSHAPTQCCAHNARQSIIALSNCRYPDGQHNKQRRRLSCFTQSTSNGLSTSSTRYAEGKNPLQSAHNLGRLRVQQTRPSRVALRLSCRYLSCRSRTKNVIQDGPIGQSKSNPE